ncbi:MAG: hypothetical protein M5U19_22435 [Microthrixaceae bacterium]|nr:hypothetical protein [Microthrixaceae bacterium]
MSYGYSTDPEVDRSTNRVMAWGVVLLALMVLVFPLYLKVEPSNREESRDENLDSLATEGRRSGSSTARHVTVMQARACRRLLSTPSSSSPRRPTSRCST